MTNTPQTPSQVLAQVVALSAFLKETSFDWKSLIRDTKQLRKEVEKGNRICHPEFTNYYKLTLEPAASQAAKKVGAPELEYPAYLLLKYTWNDALMWAEEQGNPVPAQSQKDLARKKAWEAEYEELSAELYSRRK